MLAPLHDRRYEMAALERAWSVASSGAPQLVSVTGRRRVGKTFMLEHFCDGRRSVRHNSTTHPARHELRRFSDAVRNSIDVDLVERHGGTFVSWERAFRALADASRHEPTCVVIDEAPYRVQAESTFASELQAAWDHIVLDEPCRLMVVLCGSLIGVMDDLMGAQGALHGRVTLPLRLEPVGLDAVREFHPELSAIEQIEAYAACGGYPLHLSAWNAGATTEQNLTDLALAPSGILLEDARPILRDELRPASRAFDVLAAIRHGRPKRKSIEDWVDERPDDALQKLLDLRLIVKEVAVGTSSRRRPLYRIPDPYLRFWFALLETAQGDIEAGRGEGVLARSRQQWSQHVADVFEDAARDHARSLVGSMLDARTEIGRWWTNDREQTEIDIVGVVQGDATVFGETKWSETPIDQRVVRRLIAASDRHPRPAEGRTFLLYGRAGCATELPPGSLCFDATDVVGS